MSNLNALTGQQAEWIHIGADDVATHTHTHSGMASWRHVARTFEPAGPGCSGRWAGPTEGQLIYKKQKGGPMFPSDPNQKWRTPSGLLGPVKVFSYMWSAIHEPPTYGTAFLIAILAVPGKYECECYNAQYTAL